MSNLNEIAPQLPYLRRFSQALSGNQQRGDALVVATLEAVVAEPAIFVRDVDPKIATFRTFLKVWNSMGLKCAGSVEPTSEPLAAADRRLEALTPTARQAFILLAVEEFSTRDIAVILDTGETEVKALVDQASREIAEQVATKVLIIEDEPLLALDLTDLVTALGHEVCDVAQTHKAAVAAFSQHRPGLVLADVQLADGSSGLDAVNEILQSFSVPIVFITAYPERLLTGGRPEPTFIIGKPFKTETAQAVISQALFFDYKARPAGA